MIANCCLVLSFAIVINKHSSSTNVCTFTNISISNIAQMRNFAAFANSTFLNFNKCSNFCKIALNEISKVNANYPFNLRTFTETCSLCQHVEQ